VKRKRRVEIVVETRRVVTIRKPVPSPVPPCGVCAGPLVPSEVAVTVTGLSSRTIHRLVETGEVHFAETPAGALLVCPNSLAAAQSPPRRKRSLSS
jgi:hypothetical protein